jgi:2,3,4,5-tetrahydropyridine-2,6-dicarboxylate N-succinyltransferase
VPGTFSIPRVMAALSTAKARDLSGQSGLLFRRNSLTGSVEAITRPGTWGSLSTDLHARQ